MKRQKAKEARAERGIASLAKMMMLLILEMLMTMMFSVSDGATKFLLYLLAAIDWNVYRRRCRPYFFAVDVFRAKTGA